MNNIKSGRPVDISGINTNNIEKWLKENNIARKAIICQVIISLNNGISMTDVCTVFGVTRESVRLWKEKLRKGGLDELLKEGKVGKRSKLTLEKEVELKKVLKKSPAKYGYSKKEWTGKLVHHWIKEHWGYYITLRTAQVWLARLK